VAIDLPPLSELYNEQGERKLSAKPEFFDMATTVTLALVLFA
jgi:hypothetical protein